MIRPASGAPRRRPRGISTVACAIAATVLSAGPALADWPSDPTVNLPLTTSTSVVTRYATLSDGAGGVIAVTFDLATNPARVLAYRVDAAGVVRWPAAGVAVGVVGSNSTNDAPAALSDGLGGLFVVWAGASDSSGADLFAQRLDGNGVVLWGSAVELTRLSGSRASPAMVSDGAGGLIVAWRDFHSGHFSDRAQRVDGAGNILWAAIGVPLLSLPSAYGPRPVSDDAGGAIVALTPFTGSGIRVVLQRIGASGTTLWGATGIEVSLYSSLHPAITADAAGGAIVAWDEYQAYPARKNAQRVDANGVPQWLAGGVTVAPSVSASTYDTTVVTAAGSHGAVIAWYDSRPGFYGPHAQRLDGSGAALWGATGVAIDSTSHLQIGLSVVVNAAGASTLLWSGRRDSTYDIFAQSLSAAGAPLWAPLGVAVGTARGDQILPQLTASTAGGTIATWLDGRTASGLALYAQHLGASGALDVALPPATGVRLAGLAPSPWSVAGSAAVRFALPAPGLVRVSIVDLAGRTVRVLEDGSAPAGESVARWDGRDAAGQLARPGLYLVRLQTAGRTYARKAVLLQ